MPNLARRAETPELMDDLRIGGEELAEALRQLRLINAVLGGDVPTLEGVIRLWYAAGRPRELTMLDVGAGSGDLNRTLLRWARWYDVDLKIVLVDIHPETCAAAAQYWRDEPQVRVVCSDLLHLALRRVDIVTASLVAHHFADAALPSMFGAMLEVARLGVVINDLHRHPLAFAAISLATRLLSRNRMIRNDAPLSVQRGFTANDFARLQRVPALAGMTYRWRPFFRWLVIIQILDK